MLLFLFLHENKSFAVSMLWSEAWTRWHFFFYFVQFVSAFVFLHLFGDGSIKSNLLISSVTFLLAELIFILLNFVIIINNIRSLDIILSFQFLFESWKCVVKSCFSPRMAILEHFVILVGFHVIRIVQLFQWSEFLINNRTNKTLFILLSREHWFCWTLLTLVCLLLIS